MNAAKRARAWIACLGLVAALPAFMPANAAATTTPISPSAISARSIPFLPLTQRGRVAAHGSFQRHGSAPVTLRGTSAPTGSSLSGPQTGAAAATPGVRTAHSAALDPATPPDDLSGFAGTAQASTIHSFGPDQEVTPPNEDIAAGLTDLVEVVNSTVEVFSRSGAVLGSADLNTFMRVDRGYHSSDPRVLYDPGSARFWITVTEVPNAGCPRAAPVLVAVSPTGNPLPLTHWLVYALPLDTAGTLFGDQPGIGVDASTITVTFNDFSCALRFLGSEVDILQKSDLANDVGLHQDDVFTGGPFAPQPVQSLGAETSAYLVTNESDCVPVCAAPAVEVDRFQGTPEAGGVFLSPPSFVAMTPTAVNDSTGLLPPADQPSPGPTLQTNDDRFLNAVESQFGQIWAGDGTSCQPSGDSAQRACLDYVDIAVGAGASPPTLSAQLNDVGVNGADLFYPAVSADSAGDMFTVFDESSTSMFPSVMDATVLSTGSTLSAVQTLHTSSTYYNGAALFGSACDSEGCRWGDYSGAAQDPANGTDVWVVSGSADGSVEGACTLHACWNTRINQLTVTGPSIDAVSPLSGPWVGGQTVTVGGNDFAADTTLVTEVGPGDNLPIPVHVLTPESLTFVTPPASATGGGLDLAASDSLGAPETFSGYTYVRLANYVPVSPFRILDTRNAGGGGALGPGAVRTLRVTGVGAAPVPGSATAVVLNVTEVNGSGASLLTVFPAGTPRPNASNLNFAAHTVIANLVTATLNGGMVSVYNAVGTVNVLVDVEGYFTPQPSTDRLGLFHPIAPVRVCDTRSRSPTPACRAHGALGAEAAMVVDVTGAGSAAIPGDGTAGAAVLNVTGVAGRSSTYLSVFPTNPGGGCAYTGTHAPPFSTLNLAATAVGANRVMVELGPGRNGPGTAVCVYNAAGTVGVIIDANGWFGSATAASTPPGYQYQALAPTRICDTRIGSATCARGAIGAALSRLVGVAGIGDVPAVGAATVVVAVIANLTAISPSRATYLTLYPSEAGSVQAPPLASDLNVNAGETLPNLAVVQLNTAAGVHDGFISLFNSVGSVNAVIDLEGWFQ